MTKETLQALAEELAQKRGNPNEAARCKAILNEICAYEMSMFKQGANGKAYFPLLGEFNGQLDFNVAWDRFTECLLGLLKTYDPNAVSKRGRTSTFASSLANRLRWRIINFLRDNKSADYEDSPDALDSMAITDEYFEPSVTDFDVYIHVAEIIARVKAAEQNYSKSKRSYFEGFFTFDTTKLAKGKVFERDEYLGANDAIFPSLEAVLLKYLMRGTFEHIKDVLDNELQDPAILTKRIKAICDCYAISDTTADKRSSRYKNLLQSTLNDIDEVTGTWRPFS